MEARLSMFVLASLALAAMLHGSSAQTTHVVGNALGWFVAPGDEMAYRTWAANRTFVVGDILVFNFVANAHDVAEVTKESFDSCNTTNPISISTTSPTNITLSSAGEHHFLCTFPSHCSLGQKLAINVTGAPPPQSSTPAPATAPSPSVGMTYTVGDSLGWTVPPGGPLAYQTWARGKSFLVGDTLVFNFTNGAHNVLKVTKAEFDSCSVSTTTTAPTAAAPARIALTSAGEHYYMCTVGQHCSLGQKLAINVTGGGAAPAPSPSTPPPPPSSPATPTPSSDAPPPSSGGPSPPTSTTPAAAGPDTALLPPPPPSSGAASVAAAAWPFFFVALAFVV